MRLLTNGDAESWTFTNITTPADQVAMIPEPSVNVAPSLTFYSHSDGKTCLAYCLIIPALNFTEWIVVIPQRSIKLTFPLPI